jgi:uncharacterized protein (DUF885 family)
MTKINRRTLLQSSLAASALASLPVAARAASGSLDSKLAQFFEDSFVRDLKRSPLKALRLGIHQDMDKLDDNSEHAALDHHAEQQAELAKLARDFPLHQLSAKSRREVAQFKFRAFQANLNFTWRDQRYPLHTTGGIHVDLPITLFNNHKINSLEDAEGYIARLNGFDANFNNVRIRLDRQESYGVKPPKFFFPIILKTAGNQVTGKPFDNGPNDSPLLADFKKKLSTLGASEDTKTALLARAEAAMKGPVARAYGNIMDWATVAGQSANEIDGVWKHPQGDAFYAGMLQYSTTLPLTAEQIHEIGLKEVARIHGDMKRIMDQVSFKGSLQDFFKFMRDDPQFFFDDSAQGKAAYLKFATEIIDAMRAKLGGTFGIKPKAPLEVRAVEAFREGSSASAFYNSPSADGTRPGIFYVNLSNMKARPKNMVESLAYHEGIPGHHMQISIAQELPDVPRFQSLDNFNSAFGEGWGLYAEQLGKEMGFFTDPYADFGRLTAEVWRAIRLVVDTGIHAKKWTKEQATDYFVANSALDRDGCFREISRYIGTPGQATSYKIGMLKILELRGQAQAAMGSKFTLPHFHDTVLGSGSVSLAMLSDNVKAMTRS